MSSRSLPGGQRTPTVRSRGQRAGACLIALGGWVHAAGGVPHAQADPPAVGDRAPAAAVLVVPRLPSGGFLTYAGSASARVTGAAWPGVAARQASVQGIVTDASNGRPLEGASIVLTAGGAAVRSTLSDRNGFYQFPAIEAGSYTLRIAYIGFIPHEQSLTLSTGDHRTLSVPLAVDPLRLGEIVALSPLETGVRRELGRQRVTPAQIRLAPTPAGSGDIATYLQTIPGVVAVGDRGGQLFVRGGNHTENLALMDGLLIYQPFHIVGFFSVFPEELVASADFYAGGFGARYSGRTSSVLDVQMRDGDRNRYRGSASLSPFVAEARVEGPIREGQVSWIAAARRSLIEHTSPALASARQPLDFQSQYLKLTTFSDDGSRCSATALRTADEGRLDLVDDGSRVGWTNLGIGGRCLLLFGGLLRVLEVNVGYSSVDSDAVVRGTSEFTSTLRRYQMDVNTTNVVGASRFEAGYFMRLEETDYNLAQLVGLRQEGDYIWGFGGYAEAALPLGRHLTFTPGAVLTLSPAAGLEPRLRAAWRPLGRDREEVSGAIGLYRQPLTGISDTRDVGSVFIAWKPSPAEAPMRALHAQIGWQQSLGARFQWGLEGYHKSIRNVPVPVWSPVAQFSTELSLADGRVYGADLRLEYNHRRFYGFVGYGFGWTEYHAAQDHFGTWFGVPVQRYHPPHDRRHQVSAMGSVNFGAYTAGARWQLGSELPFTRPMGFDEMFDFRFSPDPVNGRAGTTRMVLDRPYQGRLPLIHRLDLSLDRGFSLPFGRLEAQVGAINAYDRTNIFFYDLYTQRRLDQLRLVPYASLTLASR